MGKLSIDQNSKLVLGPEAPIHQQAYERVDSWSDTKFDLPDLVAALSPRSVRITTLVDAMGYSVPAKLAAVLCGLQMAGM